MTERLIVLDFYLFTMCSLGVGAFFRGEDWTFGAYRALKLEYVKYERYRPHPIDLAQRPQELIILFEGVGRDRSFTCVTEFVLLLVLGI